MSKDLDKTTGETPAVQGKERRRRRKKGGLRVPSDNVPRRAGSNSDAEISAPVPEDPSLAVSVAYAFGADSDSRPVPRVDSEAEADDSSPNERPAASADAQADADAAASAGPTNGATDDVVEDAEPEGGSGEGDAIDDIDDLKTREMPAVSLDALGLGAEAGDDDDDEHRGNESDDEPRSEADRLAASGDSVDIAFDEDDDDERGAARVAEASASEPSAAPAAEETADAAPAVPKRAPRAATVALSDEDLEELREPVAAAEFDKDDRTPPPPPVPAIARAQTEPPQIPAATREDGESEAEAAGKRPVPGVPAAVATLEENLDEPMPSQPADSGDSGEIITDDLIEEVDPAQPVTPPPPPAAAAQGASPAAKKAPPEPPPAPKKNAARAAAVAAAAQPKARRRKGKPWFEEIFDEDYLRTLPFLTPHATQREARFVVDSLELEAGTQVLDVGCGYGRHAMELAARGYHVVALDLSLPLLLRGADEAQRRGLNINFVHGDMRELTFDAQFDGAYCLFSTFGYFDDETNKKTAQNIARALKVGGKLIIEVLNRDYLIADLPARVWWEGDGCVVLEEVDFNYFSSRIVSSRSVVFDDGRQLEQEISMRAYSLHELGKLLHAAGFRVLEVSGAMVTRGRFFGAQSREIIVVAEKRATRDAEGTS